MYKDIITLFNRYVDSMGNTLWFPHVLTGVNFNGDRSVIVNKYGEQSKDNAVLNIKYHIADSGKMVNNLPYLDPKEWEKQVNDDLPKSITFAQGNDFDFFMLGDYGSEEVIEDSKGTFFREMQQEYSNVYAITSVAEYSVIPHFQITGK